VEAITAAAADRIWRQQLGELLTIDETARRLRCSLERVRELIASGRLLALPTAGTYAVPGFQITDQGAPVEGIEKVIAILAPTVATPFTIASWLTGPQAELGEATPAVWLRASGDVEPVLTSARRQRALLTR
jgi:excisionase family DNA binding protein